MSSWVALNVEPDEAVEEEVDDTKEAIETLDAGNNNEQINWLSRADIPVGAHASHQSEKVFGCKTFQGLR
jgi:hypothetical protein